MQKNSTHHFVRNTGNELDRSIYFTALARIRIQGSASRKPPTSIAPIIRRRRRRDTELSRGWESRSARPAPDAWAWAAWGRLPKAFYPWLMDLPQLTPEARQFIEDEAKRRLSAGTDAIGQGQAGLHHAMAANDPAALQAAASGLREGLQNIESGTAALRALKEGAAPRQIALAWFRGQTGLNQHDQHPNPGPFGWSWFHLIAMLFLGAFVLGTLLIHFARMRRISELTARLATRPAGTAVPAPVLPPIVPPVTAAAGAASPSPAPPAPAHLG